MQGIFETRVTSQKPLWIPKQCPVHLHTCVHSWWAFHSVVRLIYLHEWNEDEVGAILFTHEGREKNKGCTNFGRKTLGEETT
jgi:hypothetical protein